MLKYNNALGFFGRRPAKTAARDAVSNFNYPGPETNVQAVGNASLNRWLLIQEIINRNSFAAVGSTVYSANRKQEMSPCLTCCD